MMKHLIAITLLTFSLNALAVEFYGKTLIHEGKNEYRMSLAAECLEINNDDSCEKMQLYFSYGNEEFSPVGRAIFKNELKEIAHDANKFIGKKVLENYERAFLAGTNAGVVLGVNGDLSENAKNGLTALGVGIDIVKAPVVGVAFVGSELVHGAFGKLGMLHLLHDLVDSKGQGKLERITKAHLAAINQAVGSRE